MFYVRPTGAVKSIQLNDPIIKDKNDVKKMLKMRKNSFNWSLEPITKCMNVMGVSIPPAEEVKKCRSICHLYRTSCFLLVSFVQFILVIQVFFNAKNIANSYTNGISTTAFSWNFIIDNLNLALYTVGSHISFLLLTRPKTWLELILSFKLLEEINGHSSKIYSTCRQTAVKAIIYIITTNLCLDVILSLDVISNDSTWARKILDVLGLFTKIYPAVQLALFSILMKMISLQLKTIRKRFLDQFIQSHPSSLTLVESQRSHLIALRSHHRLICNTIRKLNRHFGVFLTLEVIFIFVSVINCSLFILMGATSGDGLLGGLNAAICLDSLVHLLILSSFSDDIPNQTDKVYETLLQLLHHQPSLQNEVSLFTEQLLHMKPHINAMGFFTVGKHLFPTLIGTTLTYFLILVQFHSAEKS